MDRNSSGNGQSGLLDRGKPPDKDLSFNLKADGEEEEGH
jgi:hypothetical protein